MPTKITSTKGVWRADKKNGSTDQLAFFRKSLSAVESKPAGDGQVKTGHFFEQIRPSGRNNRYYRNGYLRKAGLSPSVLVARTLLQFVNERRSDWHPEANMPPEWHERAN
jgi:hypothetical protein